MSQLQKVRDALSRIEFSDEHERRHIAMVISTVSLLVADDKKSEASQKVQQWLDGYHADEIVVHPPYICLMGEFRALLAELQTDPEQARQHELLGESYKPDPSAGSRHWTGS